MHAVTKLLTRSQDPISCRSCLSYWLTLVSIDLCLIFQPPPGPSVRTSSAVLMSSVLRTSVVEPAATVGPFLAPSTDRQTLLVWRLNKETRLTREMTQYDIKYHSLHVKTWIYFVSWKYSIWHTVTWSENSLLVHNNDRHFLTLDRLLILLKKYWLVECDVLF